MAASKSPATAMMDYHDIVAHFDFNLTTTHLSHGPKLPCNLYDYYHEFDENIVRTMSV